MCVFICFLAPGSCLLAAPSWVWAWSRSLPMLNPTRGSCLLGSDPLDLPDSSHRGAGLELRQGRQQALGLEADTKTSSAQLWPRWALGSPETCAFKSVQSPWPFTSNSKNLIYPGTLWASTLGTIFRFFLCCVSLLLFHVFILLKWSRAHQKWIM